MSLHADYLLVLLAWCICNLCENRVVGKCLQKSPGAYRREWHEMYHTLFNEIGHSFKRV